MASTQYTLLFIHLTLSYITYGFLTFIVHNYIILYIGDRTTLICYYLQLYERMIGSLGE